MNIYKTALEVARQYISFYGDTHPIDIFKFCLEKCQSLTESRIGFFHFVNPDKETISLFTWSDSTTQMCRAVESAHYPLEAAGIWANAIRDGRPIIHNDYMNMPKEEKKGLPEGHVPLLRELVVPIKQNNRVVAVLGVGNKEEMYTEEELELVQILADTSWDFYSHAKIVTGQNLPSLIPICSHCRKIRDEDGEWHGYREYFNKHSIKISDGVCPECMNKHFTK